MVCCLPTVVHVIAPRALGLVLLVAGSLKAHALATGASAGSIFLDSRWAYLGLVEFELLLGVWLLAGILQRPARAVALACFAAFLGVSAYQALSGEASCGCFGKVPVNPWLTAAFDLIAVGALCCWHPAADTVARRKLSWFFGAASAALLLLLAGAITAVRSQPAILTDKGEVVGEGQVIILEPETWIGKQLPLLRQIDIGAQLAVGPWVVVLYRPDCPRCREELAKIEQRAREGAWTGITPRVAVIDLSGGNAAERALIDEGTSWCLLGRLGKAREWFVRPPVVLRIQDGHVQSVQRPG